MDNSIGSTRNNEHKDKKIPKFHTVVHQFAKIGLNLSRRDNLVFYKLLGFLLKSDNPLTYTNEKLSLETLYKISSIKEALNNLEKLGLIEREGITYRRRFYKGKTLINICTHSQYCIDLMLYEKRTHGQSMAGTGQKSAGTGQNVAKLELDKNLIELKEGVIKNLNPKKPKPQKPKWPPITEEQEKLLGDYRHGLKYPSMQLKGIDLQIAEALYKRN